MMTMPARPAHAEQPLAPTTSTSGGSTSGGANGSRAYPGAVERLIERFARLPGVGRRSAERLAFWTLKSDAAEALALADAIAAVKRDVRQCGVCFNLADAERCSICLDERRDRGLVLVVEQPRDLIALEQTGTHRGVYHVLLGRIAPLDGVGPDDLTIAGLLTRVDDPAKNCGGERVREVTLGLNPNLEGDGTALHLADELRRRGVRVSRLARGLAPGGSLEHSSKAALAEAIEGRQEMR